MIVLSHQPKSYKEFKKVLTYAFENSADIIEVRGERLNEKELIKILKDKSINKIFTFRVNQFSPIKLKECSKKYLLALEHEVEYIDVDGSLGKNFINKLKKNNKFTKFIISYHNFEKTPKLKNLIQILEYLLNFSADIYKISTYANLFVDNHLILKLIEYAKKRKVLLIAHCMGELGKAGRFLAYQRGSLFFYTSYNDKITAPGQIQLHIANKLFNVQNLKPSTKVFGIIGNPLKQSKSWLFHNFAYRVTKTNAIYLNFLIDDVWEFFTLFKQYLNGLSVTIPFKEKILHLPNLSSQIIKKIGSANTILLKDGKPILFNTDFLGFKEFIRKNKKLQYSKVLVIGAGGSARSIIFALKKFNNDIYITNRTINRARKLSDEMGINFINAKDVNSHKFDTVINTTPGNNPFMLKLVNKIFGSQKIKLVVDLDLQITNSKLLNLCKIKKIKTINGLEFFVNQAIHQFKIFTGKRIPIRKVKKFLLENYELIF